ncbi:MAG: PRC-barrel domain-containing protein [Peptococcaceae bacterium]|jgi:uncharacterized protein YrrD|nr:PRC-barrel domain-containing protein [Peptococcaceae bacterium]
MRRTREIIGLPVLGMQSGLRIGWVQDVVYDEKTNEVTGVLLENHLFQAAKGIPRTEINAICKDALTVKKEEPLAILGTHISQKIGNRVYSQDGDARGTIQDVYLDDEGRQVVAFEVSDGLLADLLQGRGMILRQHVMADGKDQLIVDASVCPWENGEGG